MGYRILHFADLHLDKSFVVDGLSSEYGRERRLGLKAALTRILAIAREQKVDAITIGGDLFDQDYVIPETCEFLVNQFRQVDPIRVVIAPGESDPYNNDSIYQRLNWPDNVDVFYQSKLSFHELTPEVTLWGATHPAHLAENLSPKNKLDPGKTHILLLHAWAGVTSSRDSVLTLEEESIREAGFKLVLLGHNHSKRIWPENDPLFVYPGSPEPLDYHQNLNEGGAVLVTIEGTTFIPKLIPVSQWNYANVKVDFTGKKSLSEIALLLEMRLESISSVNPDCPVYTVEMSGLLKFSFELAKLQLALSRPYFIRWQTDFTLAYDVKKISQEKTVRGLFNCCETEMERRRILTALNAALSVMDGKEAGLYEISRN
jgi:DNA repair exonuclease SbcCD nuclease subunit